MNSEEHYNRTNSTNKRRWHKVSYQAKKRDNFTCQNCGTKKNLQTHHKIPVHARPELEYELDNLITLCKKCHKQTHIDWKTVTYQ